jgi:hypothetical protein
LFETFQQSIKSVLHLFDFLLNVDLEVLRIGPETYLQSLEAMDVLLAEARKFGVSIVSANQYLGQFPKNMRSAVQAIGTHIAFQLSNDDAALVSAMLDGGKPLVELLKNLPKKNFVVKSGHYPWKQVEVPAVKLEKADVHHLLERSRKYYARLRTEVEREIQNRRPKQKQTVEEALDAWE